MEGEGVGKDDKVAKYSLPHLSQLLLFDRHSPPWYRFLSLPSPPLFKKLKMAAIALTKLIQSTRPVTRLPPLRLLCKLKSPR